jgi:hypothetical protein
LPPAAIPTSDLIDSHSRLHNFSTNHVCPLITHFCSPFKGKAFSAIIQYRLISFSAAQSNGAPFFFPESIQSFVMTEFQSEEIEKSMALCSPSGISSPVWACSHR